MTSRVRIQGLFVILLVLAMVLSACTGGGGVFSVSDSRVCSAVAANEGSISLNNGGSATIMMQESDSFSVTYFDADGNQQGSDIVVCDN